MTKNAAAKSWVPYLWTDGTRRSNPEPAVINGLQFPANITAGSDIRIVWDGANLLSRTTHTKIWKAKFSQMTGYYATGWHSANLGKDNVDYNYYAGGHPFPASNGTVDGNGQAQSGSGGSGTVHFWEVAMNGGDFLCSPGGGGGTNISSYLDIWLTQAFKCEVVSGTILRHSFYFDVVNNPSLVIVHDELLSWLSSPTNPAFYFGCSDWRSGYASAGQNDETPGGILRGWKLFDAALSITDIAIEAASETDAPASSGGAGHMWYSNRNPTLSDISDKSAAGHSPYWANANRPTLWTGP